MRFTNETKLFIGIIAATIAIVLGGVFFFSKPAPAYTREELIPNGTYTTGNINAKVYLVEFSDFQCPACKAYQPKIKEVTDKYKDQLLFAYRHFPLDQHPFAQKAAFAAEAAGAQGKFWEMHDLLFENQEKFTDAIFPQLADQLQLEKDKFSKSVNDQKLKEKVSGDSTYGQRIGVDATPTFFLQGKKLNLLNVNDLENEIKSAISQNP